MRIAYVVNADIAIPVEGYGGLERQAQWMANEMSLRGHDVTIFGNVEPVVYLSDDPLGTCAGVRLHTQNDALTHLAEYREFDVVHDRTKDHVVGRMARVEGYLATLVWSDQEAHPAVYPSAAVREFYKDQSAPVVPECVPVAELPTPETGDYYLCFGRIDPIKGQDLAVKVADFARVPLVVAGHVGRWGDPYYALAIERMCARRGYTFVRNPSNEDARRLIANAKGLIHPHRWLESFSEVVAEALCQGVPVLTTEPGAPKEWVTATDGGSVHPVSGFEGPIMPDWKADTWSFFDTDWPRREIMARARVLFDVPRVADRYEREYRRVAS